MKLVKVCFKVIELGVKFEFDTRDVFVHYSLAIKNIIIGRSMTRYMIVRALCYLLALLAYPYTTTATPSNPHNAESTESTENGFVPATVLERDRILYPTQALSYRRGGMVAITYMVDKNGNAFAPFVTHSSDSVFEGPALKAVLKTKHRPATLNGQRIESLCGINIKFMLAGQDEVVSKNFYREFMRATRELDKPAPKQARLRSNIHAMEKSSPLTPHALWKLHYIKFAYAKEFESQTEQLDALQKMLLFEDFSGDEAKLANDDERATLQRAIFSIEAQRMRLPEALSAYNQLTKFTDNIPESIEETRTRILQTLASNSGILSPIHIKERGYDFLKAPAPKKKFNFQIEQGSMSTVKLRCEKKYVELDISPNLEYRVPDSWGECQLQIIGEPETSGSILFFD